VIFESYSWFIDSNSPWFFVVLELNPGHQFPAQFEEMDTVSKFFFVNRILPQSARFHQYTQSPIKPGYIHVTEEGLMEVLMADREIEAFLRELFDLENCRSLHFELRRISKVEKGSLICRLLLSQFASNMKHGYFATAGTFG
jgi:hypothetical protein